MDVCLVTGAAGGIGKAIVRRFAEAGYRVVAADRDADAVREVADATNEDGCRGEVHGWQLDVTSDEANRATIDRVQKDFGRLDCLVNNAGVQQLSRFGDVTHDEWTRVLDVNLWGAASLAQAAAAVWRGRPGGAVVNIGSRVWLAGGPISYAASKAGVVGLTRSLAVEFGRYDVTVNAVAPSTVLTPIVEDTFGPDLEAHVANATRSSLLSRLASSDDVANAVAFLGSPQARFITGEVLHVCGGAQLAPSAF